MSMDKKRNYQLNKLPLGATGAFIPMVLNRIKPVSCFGLDASSKCLHSSMTGIHSRGTTCTGAFLSNYKGSRFSSYPFIHQNDVCGFPTSSTRKTETTFPLLVERQTISLSNLVKILPGMLDLSALWTLVVDHLATASTYIWNQSGLNVWENPSVRKMASIRFSVSE